MPARCWFSQGPLLRTRILQSAAEFRSIESLWRELASSSPASIFQSFGWNRLAADCFARKEALFVISCDSDRGAAIVPAVIRIDGSLGLIGEELFDYRDVLHAGDESVLEHAWQRFAALRRSFRLVALRGEQNRRRWRKAQLQPYAAAPCVRLQDLRSTPSTLSKETGNEGKNSHRASGVAVVPGAMQPAHGATSATEQCRDEFLGAHSRLRRHARRLADRGAMLRRHAGGERELARFIYESKGQQAASHENLFQDPSRREFMIQIAAEEESRCEIFTYETHTQLVAAMVTFRDDQVRHFYTTYYDARWADFSPGQLLLFEASAITLAEGLDCDYMTGESLFKNRLATSRVPLWRIEVPAEELPSLFSVDKDGEREPLADSTIAADHWPRSA